VNFQFCKCGGTVHKKKNVFLRGGMKKFLIMLVCAFAVPGAFAEVSSTDLSKFASVNTIESKFTMTKYVSIAEQPLVSSGHFYFQRPDSLYWEYAQPYSYGFVVHDKKTLSWQEKNGKKEIKDISRQPAAREMAAQLYTFVSMDMEKISKVYEVEYLQNGIVLHPKNKSKKQMIQNIKIHFAADIAAVSEVIISERTGDRTVISFTDTKIDGQLPQNAFTL
jgi:outer membrane lipoprotein-sorting protein